jgi:hypothetical protein
MIDSGKRVVVLWTTTRITTRSLIFCPSLMTCESRANTSNRSPTGDLVAGKHHMTRQMLPSPVQSTVASRALLVRTRLNRLPSGADRILTFPVLINYFRAVFGILIPDRFAAPATNSIASRVLQFHLIPLADFWFIRRITANVNECLPLNGGFNPTFILLDWVDQGQAFTAANMLNGIS